MSITKNWTGERLETFIFSETTIEHLHRYALAMELAKGKKVLDIASGEGYGSNLLSQYASHVTGVDIDAPTVDHAKIKYNKQNLVFKTGSVENIPCVDHEFDVVVSFETIEHIADHQKMLSEIKRVIKADGILIISTPDKKNYSDKINYQNPHHVKELYREEFVSLLNDHFNNVQIADQQISNSSLISSDPQNGLDIFDGDFEKINAGVKPEPVYFIAFASDIQLPVARNSLFLGKFINAKALVESEQSLKKTFPYRLGYAMLLPFKWLKKLFK